MNEIINKTDGTILKWSRTPDNSYFCLLYSDNKNNYSFTPTTNLNCKLFMIGGGGAGGYYFGGGGGAGAAYYDEKFTFKKGITYNFTIGNGGKCDISDLNSLFSQGLTLNIYNNVNIDFNNISFTLDDYSSLNINNSGLLQNFIVNTYDTNINIPNSIWNNNTFYIWSGYIIPTTNDEYIKININTNINTAIWIDNYMYKNDNALILNTNNSYLNDVKIIKIDPKRYYNIKIIAYCNNNSSNNNFNISFSNNCSLHNYNKNNEKYVYLNATDTTLNYNDPSLDVPINTFICNGGGNGGCGFFNQNNNLDGGCGGGSGINKKNGKSLINKNIYKGTDGAIGAFCGGGGGISTAGKDNVGGDGIILDWFDNKLFFGCGGNGGNFKDSRSLGYGCGGNGGDCCYYSKEIINNNGKNGCVLIYVNVSDPLIENFTNKNNENGENGEINEQFYNFISDKEKRLKISDIYMSSIGKITNMGDNIPANMPIYEISKPSDNIPRTYAGYFKQSGTTFPSNNAGNIIRGNLNSGDILNGVDKFYNYFKYNTSYIYDIICFHKFLIALYKILFYQLGNNPYDVGFYDNLRITFDDSQNTGYTRTNSGGVINLANIFNIDVDQFTNTMGTDAITNEQLKNNYKRTGQYTNCFYGINENRTKTSLKMSNDCFEYNYTTPDTPYPALPYYNVFNSANNTLQDLIYIKDYLTNDYINSRDETGNGITNKIMTNNFINSSISQFSGGTTITLANVESAYNAHSQEIENYNPSNQTFLHLIELQLLYITILRDVLDPKSMPKICGRLYFFAHQFNLIIINLNLQYGLYRLLFAKLSNRAYIKYNTSLSNTATRYLSPSGLGDLSSSITTSGQINITPYKNNVDYSRGILNKIYELFQNFKIKDTNANVHSATINNNIVSKSVIETQLKLNKIIKKYNDELQVYNTTLNIYKAIIVIAIILLILILYIFTISTDVLNKGSKISIFIILGAIILGVSIYFAYNNSLLYENFTNNIIEGFGGGGPRGVARPTMNTGITMNQVPVLTSLANFAPSNLQVPIPTPTPTPRPVNKIEGFTSANIASGVDVINHAHLNPFFTNGYISNHKQFGNLQNSFYNYNANPQGLITNFIYLSGIINPVISNGQDVRDQPLQFNDPISLGNYNKASGDHYDYLRYYIASTYNIMNNSSNIINDTNNIIAYKVKRQEFYINRYDFYVNSIEALKNNKYVYYYLSILYALCIVLLLFSLIMILIFGHSIQSIIITSIVSFLVVLVIVYYIYFKLHHRTRMQINKNYWAYNNPSDKIFEENYKP